MFAKFLIETNYTRLLITGITRSCWFIWTYWKPSK